MTEQTLTLYKFSNKAESPYLDSLLAMFYSGAARNTIGIMEAFDLNTQKESLILVGIQLDDEGKPECFPLARVLPSEEVGNYLHPDGQGGYFDPQNPRELAEYKETVRTVEDATGDEWLTQE